VSRHTISPVVPSLSGVAQPNRAWDNAQRYEVQDLVPGLDKDYGRGALVERPVGCNAEIKGCM